MTRRDEFEALFRGDPDPWNFRHSPYEAAKFAATIAALGGRRFDRALDLGCANGVLTAMLARHCGRVLAVDVAEAALDQARRQVAGEGLANVTFRRADLPGEWPADMGRADLIVLSEFLYFIGAGEIRDLAARVAAAAQPSALLLAVNTTAPIATGLSGAEATGTLAAALAALGWPGASRAEGEGWRITRWHAP